MGRHGGKKDRSGDRKESSFRMVGFHGGQIKKGDADAVWGDVPNPAAISSVIRPTPVGFWSF